eukprot:SAG22_NODE_7_length_40155_cov_25.241356_33_plen_373_part_00
MDARRRRLRAVRVGLGGSTPVGSADWCSVSSAATGGAPPSLWASQLRLDKARSAVGGSGAALAAAIAGGADLRVITGFAHNEHIDRSSSNGEIVLEPSSFPVTCALYPDAAAAAPCWVAGFMTTRQPVNSNDNTGHGAFGPTPAISLFMYNQDGRQARAAVQLDPEAFAAASVPAPPATTTAAAAAAKLGGEFVSPTAAILADGLMSIQSQFDMDTDAPSSNFTYYFESYNFFTATRWVEALHTTSAGEVAAGSFEALAAACQAGSRVKVGVRELSADLQRPGGGGLSHEVFVECGWCFYYPESRKFSAATQLVVRCAPAASPPLAYGSGNWDLGWLLVESSGWTCYRRLDPYTLSWSDREGRHALRWFVQE